MLNARSERVSQKAFQKAGSTRSQEVPKRVLSARSERVPQKKFEMEGSMRSQDVSKERVIVKNLKNVQERATESSTSGESCQKEFHKRVQERGILKEP